MKRRFAEEIAREAVAGAIGADALALMGDVTMAHDVGYAVERTLATHGRLDIVVNNAGWTHRNRPLLEVTEAEFDAIVRPEDMLGPH